MGMIWKVVRANKEIKKAEQVSEVRKEARKEKLIQLYKLKMAANFAGTLK
jgi:hypothetical protein